LTFPCDLSIFLTICRLLGESYNLALMLDDAGYSYVLMTIILQPTVQYWSTLFLKHPQLCRLEVFLHAVRPLGEEERHSDYPRYRKQSKQSDVFVSGPVVAALHVELNLAAYIRRIRSADPVAPFQSIALSDPVALENLVPTAHQFSAPSNVGVYPSWNNLLEFTHTVVRLVKTFEYVTFKLTSFGAI